ncbi:MAG: hypothetical protein Q9161_005913 [Pseudevernia consocians]
MSFNNPSGNLNFNQGFQSIQTLITSNENPNAIVLPPSSEPPEYNTNYVFYWNSVALDLVRLVTSIEGNTNNPPPAAPQNGPPSAARALGILHLAINDAYFAINPDKKGINTTYLTPNSTNPAAVLPALDGATDARLAVAGAANTVLIQLFTIGSSTIPFATTDMLTQFLNSKVSAFPNLDTLSSSYQFGVAVGNATLNFLNNGFFGQDSYRPTPGLYKFGDDPTNPVRIVPVNPNDPNGPQRAIHFYQAPFYGMTAQRVAVQGKVNGNFDEHLIADPPVGFGTNDPDEYYSAFSDIYREGGRFDLPSTKRTPKQTVTGFTWAYDGSNLLGTPPRVFNQCLRNIAWDRKVAGATDEATNADFVRVFALFNVALADAGIFAWQEKYCFEFWRPLSGVRFDPTSAQDPFWFTEGAPDTNSNHFNFKPPFPSYPSGHATFSGASFQILRLYYKRRDNLSFADDAPDDISFNLLSDELNGVSRDLYNNYIPSQPITDQLGNVRTAVPRHFGSIWDAMFDAALSRVFLGVHWRFDAFASKDVLVSTKVNPDGTTQYKDPKDIKYVTTGPRRDRPGQQFPIGGVPLGIGIANDIFESNLKPTPTDLQPDGRHKCGDPKKLG